MFKFFAHIYIVLIFSVFSHNDINAGSISTGLGTSNNGDDRYTPTLNIEYQMNKNYFLRLYITSFAVGPLRSVDYNIGFNFYLTSLKNDYFQPHLGVSILDENISIRTDKTAENHNENNFNIGFVSGISKQLKVLSVVDLKFLWETHLYLAGAGGILLATGAKQYLAINLGVTF